jgi:hypothetical protein
MPIRLTQTPTSASGKIPTNGTLMARRESGVESQRSADFVEKLCFRRPTKICRAVGLRIERRFGGTQKLTLK